MAANIRHTAEVVIPAALKVKLVGEFNDTAGGRLLFAADSQTSLAAAKTALDTLGNSIKAAAV